MGSGQLALLGGGSGVVEADETYIGNKPGAEKARDYGHENTVLALVEIGALIRSFHVKDAKVKIIAPVINRNIERESFLLTDAARQYVSIGKDFKAHLRDNHGDGQNVDGPTPTPLKVFTASLSAA